MSGTRDRLQRIARGPADRRFLASSLMEVYPIRRTTIAVDARFKDSLLLFQSPDGPVLQLRGGVTARAIAERKGAERFSHRRKTTTLLAMSGAAADAEVLETEGDGGRFGSFLGRMHRGRLPRGNSPVGLFWFEPTMLRNEQQAQVARVMPGSEGRGKALSAGLIPHNADNKIAKKRLAGRRPFERREMTCDTANTMLGFL